MKTVSQHLNEILHCPIDKGKLDFCEDSFVCQVCNAKYPLEGNILHFICKEDDRPRTPMLLSEEMNNLYPDLESWFRQKQSATRDAYIKKEFVKNYVDFSAINTGVIVDIASGPSAGFIHGTLDKIGEDTLLIATDACPCVIHGYSKLHKDKNFMYFDVDLDKQLPFKDKSIDMFTGVLMCNVSNYKNLLREIARCIKPGGKAVFHEVFYAESSESYKYLCEKDAVYASSDVYVKFGEALGLKCLKVEICWQSVGKVDPGDGMPIAETDEWFRKNIYFIKE